MSAPTETCGPSTAGRTFTLAHMYVTSRDSRLLPRMDHRPPRLRTWAGIFRPSAQ